MASAAGKSEYETEIAAQRKGLYDIIVQYDVKLELKELIYIADIIKPRHFTIASSAVKTPERISICASLVLYYIENESRYGLVSGYFKRILDQFKEGSDTCLTVRMNIKESSFALPPNNNCPVTLTSVIAIANRLLLIGDTCGAGSSYSTFYGIFT